MTRWKLTVEYDGTPFVGWQRQALGLSIQQLLEQAAARINGGDEVRVFAAGRTDAGVHALGQVVHLDMAKPDSARAVRDGLNFYLRPYPIAVLAAEPVSADFHARFEARLRCYRYRIINRSSPLALEHQRAWRIVPALDVTEMNAGAHYLTGYHDFSSFRSKTCQAGSPFKTLQQLEVSRIGDEISILAEARSFLHHQVRNMVGTLVEIGRGRRRAAWMAEVLASCDRTAAGVTAPACGLYLLSVDYGSTSRAGKS